MSLQAEFDSPLRGCSLCYRPIGESEVVWEEQTGWAKRRKQGGTNALVARKPTGLIACSRCVERARLGIHPNQLTLS